MDVYKIRMNKQYFLLYVKARNSNSNLKSDSKPDLKFNSKLNLKSDLKLNSNLNSKSDLKSNSRVNLWLNSAFNLDQGYKNHNTFSTGDIIEFSGDFNQPDGQRNEGGFNYKLYLKTKKISGSFTVKTVKKVGQNKSIIVKLRKMVNIIRNNVLQNYKNNLSDENVSLISALTIGDKTNLEKNVIQEFRDASLSHILAISGAHFSYIILLISFINKIIKRKRLGQVSLIIVILFFMQLTGNTASVVRAGIMGIMVILASMLYRKNDFITTFSISLLIQIIYNPYVIFDIGLILSYFGTFGIVYFYQMINQRIKLKILSVTLSANLLIFPIMIYNFNTFSISFVISNFFASIILGPIIILGIISNIFRIRIVFVLLNFLLTIFRKIVSICSKLPFSKIYVTTPNFFAIIIYYAFLIVLWKTWRNNKKDENCKKDVKSENNEVIKDSDRTENSKKVKSNNKNVLKKEKANKNTDVIEKKKKIIYKNVLAILMILIIIFNINFKNFYNGICDRLLINFVDVGQGDCTLIRYEGKNVLIDGGGSLDNDYNVGEKVLLPYLLDKGIKRIDYIIFSHFDTDHCQGLIYLVGKIKIKNAIVGIQAEKYPNYKEFEQKAKNEKINVIIAKRGDKISINKNIFFNVLWPSRDNLIMNNSINNNSLVCKLNYYNFTMLFTGDIEKVAEEAILNCNNNFDNNKNSEDSNKNEKDNILSSTIIKVAHHGSITSSTIDFLNEVNPKIALIGVGKNNTFGHPNKQVIERLKDNGVKVYRTDTDGEISIFVNRKGKMVNIQKFNKTKLMVTTKM